MKDDPETPEINCSILPFNPYDYWDRSPVDPDIQCMAHDEIASQMFRYVRLAVMNKSDPWAALRIFARAERALGEYVSFGFDRLEPLRQEIQKGLYRAFRVARRVFIMRALRCPPDETETYLQYFKEFGWNDADALEDFKEVQAILDRGEDFFMSLRRWSKAAG
jgi:hypothetical protein